MVLLQRAANKINPLVVLIEKSERPLQQWPVAAAMLVAIVVTLAGVGFLETKLIRMTKRPARLSAG